jgi:rubrerythrin
MKAIVTFAALFVAVALIPVSCSNAKPEKSIENLKAAISGETGASATYKAFSAKAAEEGYPNISKMFAAASAAEAIHVKNHNAVLTKLGQNEFKPTAGAPKVNGTAENIQAAVEGETYEYTVMYPGFIAAANIEKCDDAITTFTWASDAEAVHAKLYSQALNILKTNGNDETVASVWHVCPKCGDLFNTIEGVVGCPFCGTKPASFLKF